MIKSLPLKRSVILISAALAGTHALAQSEPQRASQAVLEEVIVTAQKRAQTVTEVPISVQAFGADTLEKEQFRNFRDLQFIAPTVQFSKGSAGNLSNTIYMRGLGSYSFEGGIQPSVGTVVDGVPLSRSGEFGADLGDIERIEVIMGPQGTLFGRSTTGGVINVVRKRPTQEFESSIELSATDDDEYFVKGMVSGPLSDKVRGRLNVLYHDLDDFIENISLDGGQDAGGEETWGAVAKLEVDFTDSLSVLFTADYQDTDTGSNPLIFFLADPPVPRTPVMGNGDFALGQKVLNDEFKINVNGSSPMWTDYDQGSFVADLTWDMNEAWTLRSLSSYRDYSMEFAQEIDGTPGSPTNTMNMFAVTMNGTTASNLGRSGAENNFDYLTQELRLEYNSANISAITGVFLQHHDEDITSAVPLVILNGAAVQSDPLRSDFEQDTWAVFGDLTWNMTDNLELFAGLRWTDESGKMKQKRDSYIIPATPPYAYLCEGVCVVDLEAFDESGLGGLFYHDVVNFETNDNTSDWSGRAGARWQMTPDTNIYASYSRGFIGIGVNYTRTAPPEGNDAWLDPSTADAYEIGFKSTLFDNSLQLNGAIFYIKVEDLQTTVREPEGTATRPINAGDLESQGAELFLNWAATLNLRFDVGIAYTDAEIQDLFNACYPGQTFEQGCNVPSAAGGFEQSLDGTNPPNIPEWKYTAAANYDLPLGNMPFDGYGRLSYVWQDDTIAGLKQDPLATQDSYGILNMVVGITDKEGRYDISIFGRNITDEFFSPQKGEIQQLGLGYFQYASRDAQAYWGINAKFFFD
jgi:iron complex outermembrane recepter protein